MPEERVLNASDRVEKKLETTEGILSILFVVLFLLIMFLSWVNYKSEKKIEEREKEIRNLNSAIKVIEERHREELKMKDKELKNEVLIWHGIINEMSNQSKDKEMLSRKIVDLQLEKTQK